MHEDAPDLFLERLSPSARTAPLAGSAGGGHASNGGLQLGQGRRRSRLTIANREYGAQLPVPPQRQLCEEACEQAPRRTVFSVLVAELVQDYRAVDLIDQALVCRDKHVLVPPKSVAGAVGSEGAV